MYDEVADNSDLLLIFPVCCVSYGNLGVSLNERNLNVNRVADYIRCELNTNHDMYQKVRTSKIGPMRSSIIPNHSSIYLRLNPRAQSEYRKDRKAWDLLNVILLLFRDVGHAHL